jgi:NAD(P)-dependent dehydrogenase (short-subunit alcohol dehydrogenase family)
MAEFANQVALITGAGSGIGRQLALTLSAEGAAIVAVDLKPEPLAALATELAGKPCVWAVADVTDLTGLRSAVKDLEHRQGPIDLLIANAGIGRETSAFAFRAEDVEAQIKVNLLGVANSIDAVLPGMLSRRRGHLVAISSCASYRGLPIMAGYCASKAGVNALMEGLRVELRPRGIDCTTICPGWIRTPLTDNIRVPQPAMMELDYAARRMVHAIRRRRPFYAFPASTAYRLRFLRLLPSRLGDWLVARAVRSLGK